MKTKFTYGFVAAVIFGIIIATYLFSGKDASTAVVSKCLTQPNEVIAQTKARGNTYSLHQIQEPIHTGVRELLLLTNSSGVCTVLNDEPDDLIYPLNRYTSDAVALELNKQKAGRMIANAGGKEKFEELLVAELKQVSQEKLYMPSDTYEALKAQGIVIPPQYISFHEPPPTENLESETE